MTERIQCITILALFKIPQIRIDIQIPNFLIHILGVILHTELLYTQNSFQSQFESEINSKF